MNHTTLLFLRTETQLLLAMKKRGFGQGKWNGVGGKAEAGETPEQAAIRECQEEISVTPTNLQLVGALHFFDLPDVEHYCHVFVATKWEGEPCETEEMRPQWFDISDIPYDTMWPDDRLWLPELLQGNTFQGKVVIKEDKIIEWQLQNDTPNTGPPIDQNDTMTGLSQLVWQHLVERDWDHPSERALAISISLEANELLEHYQWQETPVGDKAALAEELADIFICALEYAHILGVDPGKIIRDKLAKSAQKYPAELFKGKDQTEQYTQWLKAKTDHRRHKKGL